MFENKTLVGLGCSHTYGQVLDDFNRETCHERSWVKKLERIGNFKESVNLALPGGSNARSERVLFDFLKNNNKDLLVIFTVTELSRFETFNAESTEAPFGSEIDIGYQAEATWKLLPDLEHKIDPKKVEYLQYHYSMCSGHRDDVLSINRRIVLIHSFLKLLNIEHYFVEMVMAPGTIRREQFGFTLPFIEFKPKGKPWQLFTAFDWVEENYGLESCKHWNHEGSQGLAEYMLKYIKDNRK